MNALSHIGRSGAVVALLLSGAAMAAPRPNTVNMTCAQAANLVAARGAVVLSTGPNTYDRFVRDGRFCLWGEYTEPRWVPTRDVRQCNIGYVCSSRDPWFFDD